MSTVAEEIGLEVVELELLLPATLFDGLFAGLLAGVGGGSEGAALLLDASSAAVSASGNLVTALSPAAFVLATFSGGEAFDWATLDVDGAGRAARSEGVVV